jgi:hypothetical protein
MPSKAVIEGSPRAILSLQMRPTMRGQPYGSICQRTRHFEEIVRVAGRLNLPGKARHQQPASQQK